MGVEQRFKASSKKLIRMFGRPLTYTSITEGVYDDDLGEVVNGETKYEGIQMFASTPKYSEMQSPNLVGKKVTSFMISGSDITFTPKVQDRIVDTDATYTVLEIKPYWAAGGVALWRLFSVRS